MTERNRPAWFVCWSCGCSDAQRKESDLSERCPGHERDRIDAPEMLDVLPGFYGVHDCGVRKCEVTA